MRLGGRVSVYPSFPAACMTYFKGEYMGNKYKVYEWNIHKYQHDYKTMKSVLVYDGESFMKAFYILFLLKIKGAGCVKLEWH